MPGRGNSVAAPAVPSPRIDGDEVGAERKEKEVLYQTGHTSEPSGCRAALAHPHPAPRCPAGLWPVVTTAVPPFRQMHPTLLMERCTEEQFHASLSLLTTPDEPPLTTGCDVSRWPPAGAPRGLGMGAACPPTRPCTSGLRQSRARPSSRRCSLGGNLCRPSPTQLCALCAFPVPSSIGDNFLLQATML